MVRKTLDAGGNHHHHHHHHHHPHLISLDSDGDGEENAGGQTEVAEALSQVVEPEREAGHAESHLGMIMSI